MEIREIDVSNSSAYLSPPPRRTFDEDRPTLLVTYWLTAICIVLIFVRTFGRLLRVMRLFREDTLMLLTIIPLLARLGFAHAVLYYGTNNVETRSLGVEEVRKRRLGSELVLCARVSYAAFIWSQKYCITEFYQHLTVHFWARSYEVGLRILRWFLLATFVAAAVTVFAECRPTHKLWQVIPDPGPQCRLSLAPLITMGSLNVITDLLLVGFVIPAILSAQFCKAKKLKLIATFSISLICVIVTLIRVPAVIAAHGAQPYRTLWASADCFTATVVANAVVINSFARDRGAKRERFHLTSEEKLEHRQSQRRSKGSDNTTARFWGSDEELAEGVSGAGMLIDARDSRTVLPPDKARRSSVERLERMTDAVRIPERALRRSPSRELNFADIGGLLNNSNGMEPNDPIRSSTSQSSRLSPRDEGDLKMIRTLTGPRSPPACELKDVGGLLKDQG